jgi:hypothetical protein
MNRYKNAMELKKYKNIDLRLSDKNERKTEENMLKNISIIFEGFCCWWILKWYLLQTLT